MTKSPSYIGFFLIVLLLLSSSCVTKKKYNAMLGVKDSTINSVQHLYDSTLAESGNKTVLLNRMQNEYNRTVAQAKANDAQKNMKIDSLHGILLNLSKDTSALNKSLRQTISGYRQQGDSLNLLRRQLGDKAKQIDDMQRAIAAQQSEMNKLKNSIATALNSFTSDEFTVHEKDGKVYVSLDEELLFKLGSADVEPKGKSALQKLAVVLQDNTDVNITIEGHTDNTGSADFNWNLSVKRSTAVIKILQDGATIEPARFTAAGRGMYQPVASNDTESGRQKNRRTEIILSPKLDQLYNLLKD